MQIKIIHYPAEGLYCHAVRHLPRMQLIGTHAESMCATNAEVRRACLLLTWLPLVPGPALAIERIPAHHRR